MTNLPDVVGRSEEISEVFGICIKCIESSLSANE